MILSSFPFMVWKALLSILNKLCYHWILVSHTMNTRKAIRLNGGNFPIVIRYGFYSKGKSKDANLGEATGHYLNNVQDNIIILLLLIIINIHGRRTGESKCITWKGWLIEEKNLFKKLLPARSKDQYEKKKKNPIN